MKWIKDILEIVAKVILAYVVAIVALALFAVGYFWFELVFMPWLDEVFSPWVVEQIRIIFLHQENFCFALGMLVFLGGPIILVVVITIMNIYGKVKKTLERKL